MPRAKKEMTTAAKSATTAVKATVKKSAEKAAKKEVKEASNKDASNKEASNKEAVTNDVVPEAQDASLWSASDDFIKILAALQDVTCKLSNLKSQVKTLEKKHTREMKAATKSKRRAASKAPRTPSGFVKPTKISSELAAFLGKADGTEMARTEVTKEINAYIRSNGLQNKDNGRIINADTKLKSLLKLKGDDELTYFNLQRYMSPHFPKTQTA